MKLQLAQKKPLSRQDPVTKLELKAEQRLPVEVTHTAALLCSSRNLSRQRERPGDAAPPAEGSVGDPRTAWGDTPRHPRPRPQRWAAPPPAPLRASPDHLPPRPRRPAAPPTEGSAAAHLDDLDEAREYGVARHGDERDVGEMLRDEQRRQRRYDRPGPAAVRPATATAAVLAAAFQCVSPRKTARAPLMPARAGAEGGAGRRRGAQRGRDGGGGGPEAAPRGPQGRPGDPRPPAPAQPPPARGRHAAGAHASLPLSRQRPPRPRGLAWPRARLSPPVSACSSPYPGPGRAGAGGRDEAGMTVALATAHPSLSSSGPCSRLPRQLPNISKNSDSVISLMTLCHGSGSFCVKKSFLIFRGSLQCFVLIASCPVTRHY